MSSRLLPKVNIKNLWSMTSSLQEQISTGKIFSASAIAKARHDMLVEFLSDDELTSEKKLAFAKKFYSDVKSEIATIGKISSDERSAFISRKNAYTAYSRDS